MPGGASSHTGRDPTAAPWPTTPPPPQAQTRSLCRTRTPWRSARMGTCPCLPHAASCAVERRHRLHLIVVH
eukprot:9685258-Prorocentrum_lima.AAC.1